MVVRLLAAVLVLVVGLGCGFLDELDNSSKEMDKYSATGRKEAAEKAKADAEKQANQSTATASAMAAKAKQAASQWWTKASSLAPDEKDPSIVRCVTSGKEEYTSRLDCQMRGGVVAKHD